jgi:L-rhamnose-H+ transport protein
MDPNPYFGVLLHAIGGLAAASFYLPYKKIRGWKWETYWLLGGFFSWIIAPWVFSFLTVPDLFGLLKQVPVKTAFWCYFFGVLWGVGGLTFGLSVRYLGMSLGYALALGFCAAGGTLIPPIFFDEIGGMIAKASGQVIFFGILVCLVGIAVCGRAGMFKEKELSKEEKAKSIEEFSFWKGVWVAIFAGIMSSCMAFGFTAGEPIAELAKEFGAKAINVKYPIFIFVMAGGFTTNFIWCMCLHFKNRSGGDYLSGKGSPLVLNYLLAAAGGLIWYMQFAFYGMGQTQMGKQYDFSSWTLHMAFIIIFSNLWGLLLLEWKGSSNRTMKWIYAGILLLTLSTVIVGYGNKLIAAGG